MIRDIICGEKIVKFRLSYLRGRRTETKQTLETNNKQQKKKNKKKKTNKENLTDLEQDVNSDIWCYGNIIEKNQKEGGEKEKDRLVYRGM